MCVHAKSFQSWPTVCNSINCSQPDSSVHGILQAKIWNGLPCPSPEELTDPRIESVSLRSPALAGRLYLYCNENVTVHIGKPKYAVRFSSVQSPSHVQFFVNPWTAARQTSLFITNSWSLQKLMSIESVIPSNHSILCRPHLLPPSIPPSIRVFSKESFLRMRWPKYWSFSFSISPSSGHPGLL